MIESRETGAVAGVELTDDRPSAKAHFDEKREKVAPSGFVTRIKGLLFRKNRFSLLNVAQVAQPCQIDFPKAGIST